MTPKIGRRLTDAETAKAAVLAAYIDASPHKWPKGIADIKLLCHGYLDLQAALAEARKDNEELDGTDAAHPAWWRGQDYGAVSICRALTEVLDGKEPSGTCTEPFETLRRRVWEAREDAARVECIEQNKAYITRVDGIWYCEWGKTENGTLSLGSGPTARAAIDAARGKP